MKFIQFVRVFLLALIIVGIGLLSTQKMWVPQLVEKIIQNDTPPQIVIPDTRPTTIDMMSSTISPTADISVPPTTHTNTIDIHSIPLGDGKVSSSPKVGYVYSCEQSFRGGGAFHAGDWIQGDTWDLSKKISVRGDVSWPSATFSTIVQGVQRLLSGNGLPVGSHTGIFPIQSSDPAYQYDRNPNSISSYSLSISLPENPQIAPSASCVPMGAIGYATNGVAIYNALDDGGRDAVAHEVQDSCDGHPQMEGQYHYHGPSDCMPHADENNALVGYALDGFGIYSRYDARGREYTNTDLDACHGTTSPIVWNGKAVTMYHYVLTREYPYTIGCFRGTPQSSPKGSPTKQSSVQSSSVPNSPPTEAKLACSGKTNGSQCSFSTPKGLINGTCKTPPNSSLACVPN